jgi:catechol 2,3-dioxygenase-like lactoylglutathione lyase family enzyme
MKMKSLTPMLQTADMDRAIDWYKSMLGFELRNRAEDWCVLGRDGIELMFMMNDHLGVPHATATQYIETDDVLGLWARLKGRVEPEWGPEEMDYGMLEFAIKDPDGYLLSFGQDVSANPARKYDA